MNTVDPNASDEPDVDLIDLVVRLNSTFAIRLNEYRGCLLQYLDNGQSIRLAESAILRKELDEIALAILRLRRSGRGHPSEAVLSWVGEGGGFSGGGASGSW